MSFKMSYNEDDLEKKTEVNGEEILRQFEEFKAASRAKTIVLILIAILATFCITILAYGQTLKSEGMLINSKQYAVTVEDSINRLSSFMDRYYKGETPDDQTLIEAALKGYIEGYGDPYTEYLTADEWQTLNESLSDFVGIGVYLSEKKSSKDTVIVGPTSDESPAALAGIKAGDIITEIDLEDVRGKGSKYVSEKVRGLEGSTVKIKVLRGEETLEFNVQRKRIKAFEIKHEMLDGNIGYIDFDSFTEESYNEFKAAMEDIMTHNPKGLIIDLRDNTGGYVEDALNIGDLFVEKGKVLLTQEDKNGYKKINTALSDKKYNIKTVILVNDYSASASEILTGIFKDYGLATVVGTKTYGKGVIQTVILNEELNVAGGALKVTTEEYFTPNGNKINEIGIEPDIEVQQNEDYDGSNKADDYQLQKALEILKK